jgi:hypothetical protein
MNCPYLPINGYGEVRVNMPLHWRWSPGERGFSVEDIVGC